jgi:hypothetical protein
MDCALLRELAAARSRIARYVKNSALISQGGQDVTGGSHDSSSVLEKSPRLNQSQRRVDRSRGTEAIS